MKRLVSNVLLVATLSATTPAFSQSSTLSQRASISKSNTTFDVLFSNYKKAIMVDGISNDIASREFLTNVQIAQIKVEDVKVYALKNMSSENYLEFEKALSSGIKTLNGKETSEKKLAHVVERLLEGQQREGANWVSCGTGLGIGIPLMVAGIVTGIVALSLKEIKVSTVEKKYIDLRKQALDEYTARENARQDDIVAYESDIAAYQNEIEELQRRINSGAYGALEEERMRQEIAALNVAISDSNAAISQLNNDQPQLYNTYQDQLSHLNELETNEVNDTAEQNARNARTKKALGITTAISLPLGLALTLGGAGDC